MTTTTLPQSEPKDCLRLALMGGPAHFTSRGMTLAIHSDADVMTLRRTLDLELAIECQTSLLQRAERIYNQRTIAEERALLTALESLRALPRKEQRYRLIDLLLPEA